MGPAGCKPLIGDGTGAFTPTATPPATGSSPGSVALGDVNGDNHLDIITANSADDTASVLLGDGTHTDLAATGTCTITANQSGSAVWTPAVAATEVS